MYDKCRTARIFLPVIEFLWLITLAQFSWLAKNYLKLMMRKLPIII